MEGLSPYITGLLAVLLLTSFVKIVTTLSILRFGLGLEGAGFGVVILGLALALSLALMSLKLPGSFALEGWLSGRPLVDSEQIEQVFRPFLEKQAHPEIKDRFAKLAVKALQPEGEAEQPQAQSGGELSFPALTAAFMVSELKEAFKLGFLFIVPFLVIDLLVVNILMALGMMQMPHSVVSLPLKILLFFAVDGWTLVSEKLLSGYF